MQTPQRHLHRLFAPCFITFDIPQYAFTMLLAWSEDSTKSHVLGVSIHALEIDMVRVLAKSPIFV